MARTRLGAAEGQTSRQDFPAAQPAAAFEVVLKIVSFTYRLAKLANKRREIENDNHIIYRFYRKCFADNGPFESVCCPTEPKALSNAKSS